MHRSLASMRDLPLLTSAGVRMGEITDALYDPFEQRVIAFSVNWEDNVILGPDIFLPLTQLLELNADIGTVADEIGVSAGLEVEAPLAGEGWVFALENLLDRPVTDSTGASLGHLADVHFDPQDGSVRYYEVAPDAGGDSLMVAPTAGFDIGDGKVVIPANALAAAQSKSHATRLGIAFLDAEDEDDRVGEDDLEVSRSNGAQPT